MSAVIVLCTRPDSARLPGKAFKRIAGVPAIEHILSRVGARKDKTEDKFIRSHPVFPVILAVPEGCNDYDDLIRDYDVTIYDGQSDSPLHRMAAAIRKWSTWHAKDMPNYVVRITHDDILIDARTMVDLVAAAEKAGAGYAITPTIVDGAGVEVIDVANVLKAAETSVPVEHISYFVRGHGMTNDTILRLRPRPGIERPYRLTLDYPEDAAVLEAVLRATGPLAPLDDVCAYLDDHRDILKYNAMPAVSVYIPAFNAEKFVQEAIRSVPAICSAGRVELVVAEDRSTDGTLAKILEVGDKVDRLIINEKNLGSASTANAALKACRGRYVIRLDADDILCGGLDAMLYKMKETGAGVVYPAFREIDHQAARFSEVRDPRENHHAGCALMDRKAFDVRYEEGRRHWDGLELLKRIRNQGVRIAYFEDYPLWFYRKNDKSLSADMGPERKAALESIGGFRP